MFITWLGVAAGSLAAFIQSAVYGGATTGLFSVLQSAGAVGISAGTSAIIGTVAGGTAKVITDKVTEEKEQKEAEQPEDDSAKNDEQCSDKKEQ